MLKIKHMDTGAVQAGNMGLFRGRLGITGELQARLSPWHHGGNASALIYDVQEWNKRGNDVIK